MTRVFALLLVAALLAPVSVTAHEAEMTTSATIAVRVDAPVEEAFRLFDPINESKWDPDWKPTLLGDRVQEGLVFLVGEGDRQTTWVIDRYDPVSHSIGYINVSKTLLTRIGIALRPNGRQSVATITFTRTALSAIGFPAVQHFAAHFLASAPHWEAAINGYLAK